MRNIRLTLEYDGTDFAGWQFQPNGRSVQETLEAARRLQHEARRALVAQALHERGDALLGMQDHCPLPRGALRHI